MDERNEHIDSLVSEFEAGLKVVIAKARRAVLVTLGDRLSVTDGVIARTRTNARVLRTIRDLFTREMKRAGFDDLVDTFAAKFNGQFVFFTDQLEELGHSVGQDLTVKWGQRDRDYFSAQQVNAIHLIKQTVDQAAQDAQRQAMFGVGGLKLADLTSEIADQFDKSVVEAKTVADTALASFYRVITDRGYKKIEGDLKGFDVRYKYVGPMDKLNRPFCRTLVKAGLTYTRPEIDAMNNGQIPNVWVSCGGWLCRHQWVIAQDTKA